jgi:hypothetical protein
LNEEKQILTCGVSYDDYENKSILNYFRSNNNKYSYINTIFTDAYINSNQEHSLRQQQQESMEENTDEKIGEDVEQEQQQEQEQRIGVNPNPLHDRPEDPEDINFDMLYNYGDYVSSSFVDVYYNAPVNIGKEHLLYVAKNIKKLEETPFFLIKKNTNVFAISYIEGVKLIDFLKADEDTRLVVDKTEITKFRECTVYDSKGNVYFGNDSDSFGLICQSVSNCIKILHDLKFAVTERLSFKDCLILLITTKINLIIILKKVIEIANLTKSTHIDSEENKLFYNIVEKYDDSVHDDEIASFIKNNIIILLNKVSNNQSKDTCVKTFDEFTDNLTNQLSLDKLIPDKLKLKLDYLKEVFEFITFNMNDCAGNESRYNILEIV